MIGWVERKILLALQGDGRSGEAMVGSKEVERSGTIVEETRSARFMQLGNHCEWQRCSCGSDGAPIEELLTSILSITVDLSITACIGVIGAVVAALRRIAVAPVGTITVCSSAVVVRLAVRVFVIPS